MNLWITYSWKDNDEGNFDYLVQELAKAGIEAKFDKVELIPGQQIWAQIGAKISNSDIDGWAYLITPKSLASNACKEELEYALNRAIDTKSYDFPLIGYLHNVSSADVPIALKSRICINLNDQHWIEQTKAALEHRAPKISAEIQDEYIFNVYEKNVNGKKLFICQIYPRFKNVVYWRIAVPANSNIVQWGYGPADGNEGISMIKHSMIEGTDTFNGVPAVFKGAEDQLSASVAAKIIIEDEVPEFFAFTVCSEPFEVPQTYQTYYLKMR